MSTGFYNQTSAFFEIKINGNDITDVLGNRIVSFSITEELNKIFSGSIETFDPNSIVTDKLLIMGKSISISWGYKKPDTSLLNFFAQIDNPDEITGQLQRSDVNAFVTNVSGSGGSDGVILYTANFLGTEYKSGGKQQIFSSGTRESMIQAVLTNGLKIPVTNQLINFKRGKDLLSQDTAKVQYESHFRFLNRMALEHGTVFAVGNGRAGKKYALFADFTAPETKQFASLVGGSAGSSLTLNYKGGTPNVENYSFDQSASNATGDSSQIMMIGGQMSIRRYKASETSVTDYKINMTKLQADMKAQGGPQNITKYMQTLLSANSFDAPIVKQYFIASVSTSAPQGYGWTAKVKMLGNPLVTAPMKVIFGKGFPSIISGLGENPKTNFWIRSVTHTINQAGYHMDLDIVDALTLTGGSFVG